MVTVEVGAGGGGSESTRDSGCVEQPASKPSALHNKVARPRLVAERLGADEFVFMTQVTDHENTLRFWFHEPKPG